MKISIITICYNNERDIRATLESVVNQSYKDIEYIVVDGASKDRSLDIINEYKDRIAKIVSEPDNGMYEALNKGFRLATGDVVGMIHAGDRLYNSHVIENIVRFFAENEVDMVYGNSLIVDKNDHPKRVNISPNYTPKLAYKGWMPSHQSIYCRKGVFDVVGYYRNDLGGGGDYEWFVRAFVKCGERLKIKGMNEFVIRFSLGGQSTKNYSAKLSKKHFEHVKRCWTLNGLKPPFAITWKMFGRKIRQFILAKTESYEK